MRNLSRVLAVAALATIAACGGTAEVPEDVDVDVDASVKTDTVAMPNVEVNRDTVPVVVPDVDVKRGGNPPPQN